MADLFKRIREYNPMVHIITNAVAINDSANFVIAAGGKPICGYDKVEVEDITGMCNALLVNIGMPNDDKNDGILLAVKKAKAMNIPVVLDPVGIGVSQYRQNLVRDVISTGAVSAIRGNRLEIEELIRTNGSFPDSITLSDDDIELFARENNLIIMATGERDYIWGDGKYEILENGTVWQSRMTGCGCALSALIAAALGSCDDINDRFDCCVDALRSYNEAAEIAVYRMNQHRRKGTGSFRTYLADVISDGFACKQDLRSSLQLYAITDRNLIRKSDTYNILEDAVLEAIDG
ncbi:MAG: hydroxyethylthiazole kinase, partial [Lachnospiraceae bacterium]|nr:hydroxyethylthiazole kinase [Lachnospiraceae bacterium]